MEKWNLDGLRCVRCKKNFFLKEGSNFFSIVKCGCREYPLVNGILYLGKDSLRKKALKFLEEGKDKRATLSLIGFKRRLSLPIFYLLLPNAFNKSVQRIFGRHLYEILGFKRVVRILTHFSYPSAWAKYIQNREQMPSFFTSILAANLLKGKYQKVVDIGCGSGQLLKVLAQKVRPENIIGLDKSFFSLFLARRFFASRKSLLICADVEEGLPFISESFDLVLSTDSFHYLKNKSLFLKESLRTLKPQGVLAALHIVNSTKIVFGNVRGITPKKLSIMLKKAGAKTKLFHSNTEMWESLEGKTALRLDNPRPSADFENAFAYGFFAGKNRLKGSLELSRRELHLFEKAEKNFNMDKELLNELNLKKTCLQYDNFVFLSPHLDDAILSCGLLLEKLGKLGKKVEVVSVFSQASPAPYSQQAKVFMQKSGLGDWERLFAARRKEDIKALNYLKAGARHLNYQDATFRKTRLFIGFPSIQKLSWLLPGLIHVYPGAQNQFSGKVSSLDNSLVAVLKDDLKKRINEQANRQTLLLAPLGIGGHADHVLVRKLVQELGFSTLFWSDFPYNLRSESVDHFFFGEDKFRQYFELKVPKKTKKYQAIGYYRSQIRVLFPNGIIPKISEKYYVSKDFKI